MTYWGPSRNRHLGLMVVAVLLLISSCAAQSDLDLESGISPPEPPEETAPDTTVPDTTVPDGTEPEEAQPGGGTEPEGTEPEETDPDPTDPDPTVPDTTVPGAPKPDPTPPGTAGVFRAASTEATIGGCEIFPPNHYLNAINVDEAPRAAGSSQLLSSIAGAPLRLPSSSIWEGSRGGMPINIVDSSTRPKSHVNISSGSSRTYRGKYPIPAKPLVEGHPGRAWDAHLLMLDVSDCRAYELIQYDRIFGHHFAWNGATYLVDTVEKAPNTTNSPNTPMIGQYLMRHEVREENIPHVLSWCTNRTAPTHTWPARVSDGTHPDGVPMGTWLRLKPSFDRSPYTGGSAALVETLATRGMVLTDTCGHAFSIYNEQAEDWREAGLDDQLSHLNVDDFEVVEASVMRDDDTTFAVR